jgi:hypothetical protein
VEINQRVRLSTSTPSIRRSNGTIVASMAWNLDAVEQTPLWRQHRVDGVGRLNLISTQVNVNALLGRRRARQSAGLRRGVAFGPPLGARVAAGPRARRCRRRRPAERGPERARAGSHGACASQAERRGLRAAAAGRGAGRSAHLAGDGRTKPLPELRGVVPILVMTCWWLAGAWNTRPGKLLCI